MDKKPALRASYPHATYPRMNTCGGMLDISPRIEMYPYGSRVGRCCTGWLSSRQSPSGTAAGQCIRDQQKEEAYL
ncbi:hypothetical protein ACVNS2_05445 [Paenibacillus caseinilyticus]|uniref:Uncharacterized protein n=1 Tax=Paenibacillus mucilaginosus K02 TaxID=997761 RepID=I0BCM2_9BACL|nr:hypothetical protein [Paenibacillus mucilaginosus]AFH60119.1 hypothetical protein B2K_05170 [Paenibacillus mucilaginosus K02]